MKSEKYLIQLLYYVLILLLLFVIIVSFCYPENNLLSGTMVFVSACFFGLLMLGGWLWTRIYYKVSKMEPCLYYMLLFLLGMLLFIVSSGRSALNTNTLVDYSVLYYTAGEYADGKYPEESSYYFSYFSHYNNNLRPMILLSWLFRLASFFRVSRFHFLLFVVCMQVVLVAWSMGVLVSNKSNKTWRVPMLLLLVTMLPLWCMTAAFYTDTMSMGLCIISMALLKILCENCAKLKVKKCGVAIFILSLLIIAFFVVLSIFWKITSLIPFIAYAVAIILCKEKNYSKLVAFSLIVILIELGIFSCIFNSYESVQMAGHTSDPLLSWVAIGMKGDGTWAENSEFVHTLHKMNNTAEKRAYTKIYIEENLGSFWDINHIVRKVCRNFADGNLDVKIFTPIEDDGSIFWDMFNPWGKWYWRVSQYNFCYLEVVYFALFFGVIVNLIELNKGKKIDFLLLSTHISFLGMFVFLMIWEANSRQLYNQMPMLLLGVILFVQKIFPLKEKEIC